MSAKNGATSFRSGATAVQQVQQNTVKAVRNLPDAHASWQFFWRNAAFRRAIQSIVDVLYAVDVAGLNDDQMNALIRALDSIIKLIELHVSDLGSGVRDEVDREYFRALRVRLDVAREGFEQGLPADPQKRPNRDQLLDRFASMLTDRPLSLPDHTDCARAGTS